MPNSITKVLCNWQLYNYDCNIYTFHHPNKNYTINRKFETCGWMVKESDSWAQGHGFDSGSCQQFIVPHYHYHHYCLWPGSDGYLVEREVISVLGIKAGCAWGLHRCILPREMRRASSYTRSVNCDDCQLIGDYKQTPLYLYKKQQISCVEIAKFCCTVLIAISL